MSEEKKTKVLRKPTFLEAFTPLLAMLVILTYGFGEFIAPPADQFSREYKAQLLKRKLSARGYSSGTWVREVLQKDGEKSEGEAYLKLDVLPFP